jgi:hypothetical protein
VALKETEELFNKVALDEQNEEDWMDVEAEKPMRKKRIKKLHKSSIQQKKKLARRLRKKGVRHTNIDLEE